MKAKKTPGGVMYPTYEAYREMAGRADDAELARMLRVYSQGSRTSTNKDVQMCYRDAVRACEDETLSRQYEARFPEPDSDDPFFEAEVQEGEFER